MANMITGIISISIGAVLMASVFVATLKGTNQTYIDTSVNSSTTGTWSTSEIAMWGLISLIGIVGLVYGVLNIFGLA